MSGQRLGIDPGVHEDASALEIAGRVEPRGEQKVAFEEGLAFLEEAKDAVACLEVMLAHGA